MTDTQDIRPPDAAKRLEAATERALWELGDGSWAQIIVDAYLWPDADAKRLAEERGSDEG